MIWLGEGVIDDETSGHIDNLACFARPGEVCLTWSDDPRDPQQRVSKDAWERLMAARDARGRRLVVHKLLRGAGAALYDAPAELPPGSPRTRGIRRLRAGQRLAASYVNFYLANGAVILPLLDGRARTLRARRALRRISSSTACARGAGARDSCSACGNIHCITQQQPLRNARCTGMTPSAVIRARRVRARRLTSHLLLHPAVVDAAPCARVPAAP